MENWMSFLPDDKKLLLVNIPGAHDTAAHEINTIGIPFGQTQDKSIPELLNIGIRKLDIRIVLREGKLMMIIYILVMEYLNVITLMKIIINKVLHLSIYY